MKFDELYQFITRTMSMSHVYQPLMLLELIENRGEANSTQIAKRILSEDASQVDYYRAITRKMPGRVLATRGVVERIGSVYRLPDFSYFLPEQVEALKAACHARLDEYVAKRGAAIWDHRRSNSGYISGTLRYEVLKTAKFRCELCGISADVRALEVDHIVPRSKGGSDDLTNLQCLCYSCNAMKRDRDDTDFRAVRAADASREPACPFCALDDRPLLAENELARAFLDGFPVTPGHALIVPKRHVADYFELGVPEVRACHLLLSEVRKAHVSQDETIEGFNIGINAGEVAGQTVMHCHMHLIPRRKGDHPNPRGGVRHVIPGKGDY